PDGAVGQALDEEVGARPGVVVEGPQQHLEHAGAGEVDDLEARPVEVGECRRGLEGPHPQAPQALLPVAEGLVDEVDVHRCPLQAGTMLSSGVPHSTLSPLPTWMALTVPAMSACTGVMSFITSMMHSCWPATTAVPTSTKGGAPGSGAR